MADLDDQCPFDINYVHPNIKTTLNVWNSTSHVINYSSFLTSDSVRQQLYHVTEKLAVPIIMAY